MQKGYLKFDTETEAQTLLDILTAKQNYTAEETTTYYSKIVHHRLDGTVIFKICHKCFGYDEVTQEMIDSMITYQEATTQGYFPSFPGEF